MFNILMLILRNMLLLKIDEWKWENTGVLQRAEGKVQIRNERFQWIGGLLHRGSNPSISTTPETVT